MKTFSWNLQGMGNPWTVRALKHYVRANDPDIIFLMESRLYLFELSFFKFSFSCYNYFVVDARGRSGGLILMWKKDVDINIASYSQNHIDFEYNCLNDGLKWRGTGVYGWPEAGSRGLTWDLMRRLCGGSSLPWLVFGDFNEILFSREKEGGRPKQNYLMESFRQALDDCALRDLGWTGFQFTWDNGRRDSNNIRERLDRFLASVSWSLLFPSTTVSHLSRIASDHNLILLCFETNGGVEVHAAHGDSQRIFRFEAIWVKHPGCVDVVGELGRVSAEFSHGQNSFLRC
ncbi:uncharacterized protein LOC126672395 [Mercurialis annua]|uniref:uncharacterized protein LOC126672395 n=1 Tax=Mercurialis annua TaxID=3986 RepID=UPI00215F5ADA|nr:uncharacterized protein LOC126672395 [Mercurialis annua]